MRVSREFKAVSSRNRGAYKGKGETRTETSARVFQAQLCPGTCARVREFGCLGARRPGTFVLIKGTSKLKVMICRNILVRGPSSSRVPAGPPFQLLSFPLTAALLVLSVRRLCPSVRLLRFLQGNGAITVANASSVSRANPACSCGACLQRSIYIKRKDIPSTGAYTANSAPGNWEGNIARSLPLLDTFSGTGGLFRSMKGTSGR